GTLKGRLERARDLLRTRLARRGLAPGAALLATLLSQQPAAATPAALTQTTTHAALSTPPGKAADAGPAPPLTKLGHAGLKNMIVSKWKITLTLLLAVSLLAGGAGLATHQAPADKPAGDAVKQTEQKPKAPQNKSTREKSSPGTPHAKEQMTVTG